jgi:ribosomal protein S26
VRCEASGVLVAKDKAIKRFIVRNIVDASAIRDIQDASVLDGERTMQGLFKSAIEPAPAPSRPYE